MADLMDISDQNRDNASAGTTRSSNDDCQLERITHMGDKGGKKDKEKSKKQQASKQNQSAKGKQSKTPPK